MRNENSGGDVNYYRVEVAHPKRSEPYVAECEDIIAALGMDFFEGEAFKATWRKAAQRTLGLGKAGNTAVRDAEKMAHYGARSLAIEQNRMSQVLSGSSPKDWLPGDLVRFRGPTRAHFAKGLEYLVYQSGTPGLLTVMGDQGFLGQWEYALAAQEWTWVRMPTRA